MSKEERVMNEEKELLNLMNCKPVCVRSLKN